jgi:hypothetical protein
VLAGQGTNGGCVYTDQNEWSPIAGETQRLNANGPDDWQIVSNTPVNSSGSVTTFPNTGAEFNEQPLSSYSQVSATVDETMPHNNATSGWAMMDDWFNDWKYEVMIQHDFTRNGPCTYVAVQQFADNTWGLCAFGSKTNLKANGGAFAWKLAPSTATVGSSATINSGTITIDIKAMVMWLANNGWMDTPTITNLSDGWEICSTGGTAETFQVNAYTLTAN